jgi:hypothetical protein
LLPGNESEIVDFADSIGLGFGNSGEAGYRTSQFWKNLTIVVIVPTLKLIR